MDFDYSPEQRELCSQARRFLTDQYPLSRMRSALDGVDATAGLALHQSMADLGWTGVAIAESEGGIGLGYTELCALAEEHGRALVPGPFSSTIHGFAEALRIAGTADQRSRWLPQVASGGLTGCLAFAEGAGDPDATACSAFVENSRIHGSKWPVTDGLLADAVVVLARDGLGHGLYLVPLGPEVTRTGLSSLDASRSTCRLDFNGASAERLGDVADGRGQAMAVLERMVVMLAFEQLGGADRCLEMARAYALDRRAFGRQIGSFQAIKHRLADMYVKNELARSSAYYAAWALAADSPQLGVAAAAARMAACEAFEFAARENLQVHGGIAITWQADPHLFLRRSRQLCAVAGSADFWGERLVAALAARDGHRRSPDPVEA